jgi:hypothetical protein
MHTNRGVSIGSADVGKKRGGDHSIPAVLCSKGLRVEGNSVEVLDDSGLDTTESGVRLGIGQMKSVEFVMRQLTGYLQSGLLGGPDGGSAGTFEIEMMLAVILASVGAFELFDVQGGSQIGGMAMNGILTNANYIIDTIYSAVIVKYEQNHLQIDFFCLFANIY